jgi:hypothetical protein
LYFLHDNASNVNISSMSNNDDNSMFDCIRWLSIPNCVDYYFLGDCFIEFYSNIKFNNLIREYKSYDWKPDNVLSSIIKLHDIIYTPHSNDIKDAIIFPNQNYPLKTNYH